MSERLCFHPNYVPGGIIYRIPVLLFYNFFVSVLIRSFEAENEHKSNLNRNLGIHFYYYHRQNKKLEIKIRCYFTLDFTIGL